MCWVKASDEMPTTGPVRVRLISANRPDQYWDDLYPARRIHPCGATEEPCWLLSDGTLAGYIGNSEWYRE